MAEKKISIRKRLGLELARKIRKDTDPVLRTLFWECTLRCNAACRHCGSDCKATANSKDMPAEDFLKVIDSLTPHVDTHKTFIIFTGGEALVRPDIDHVGTELNKREYPWGIVSNGYLLNEERLKRLKAAGMHSITISLDGFEEAHDWMRRIPNGFKHAVEAIKLLAADKDLIYDVVTCANQKNYDSLAEFRDFLISIGVKAWRIFTVFPVGRAADNPELQLSDRQFTDLMKFIANTRKEGKIKVSYGCEGFLGGYETEVRDTFYQCNAGKHVASILADGSISACPSIRANYHQGNIYTDDFWDVWTNRYQVFRDRSWMKKDECGDCKMFRYCEGNGFHLRDENGKLLFCHYHRLLD